MQFAICLQQMVMLYITTQKVLFYKGFDTPHIRYTDENGNIVEVPERTGMWAWKHPHQADGTITYTKLEGRVEFDDVTFGYVENKTVLKDVSLYAKPGQKIAFVGSTGAGKTTIFNLLCKLYNVDDNQIFIDGKDNSDIGDLVLKDREMLGENGIVIISCTLDKNTKQILGGPEILTRGFIYVKENLDIVEEAESLMKACSLLS